MTTTLKLVILVLFIVAEVAGLIAILPRIIRQENVWLLYGVLTSSFSAIVGAAFILFFVMN
ncbi:MAG: hypothetical protein D6675_09050 [Gemmatimonadetes bacterium]|nr:MAG: hypothetical protein D6675_09050 [Gemmatimonadota bacterium]